MAILKSSEKKIKSKSSVLGVLQYTTNPDKTEILLNYTTNPEKASLVTAVNCYGTGSDISAQFEMTRALQKKKIKNEIPAHHYIQSFSPDDNVTPEDAHEIGKQMMKRAAPNYQYIISTHVDKQHIHNHIVINSVNHMTGYKWHDNKNTVNHMREVSDELCRANKLSVIDKSGAKGIDQTTYQLALKGKSWKINLVKDLDEAIKECKSKIDFVDFLNKRGYRVDYKNANITVTKIGEKKEVCQRTKTAFIVSVCEKLKAI